MWAMGLSKDLVEHIIFQFAIPYEEEATEAYKKLLGGNDALFQTTALTAECSDAGKVVPKVGWWAYDIDMSSLRKHDFFESNYSMMRPGMNVFHEDNVVLSSILEGSLDGTFSGNMNLNSLKGAGTTTAGLICGVLGTFGNGMFTQMKVLDCWFGTVTKGPALTAILGLALGAIGKGLEGGLKKASQDPDKLGEFSGKINLSLNARIETAGSISGERTTLVPSPELNVASFIKNEGGLVVTNDDKAASMVRSLRNQGRAEGDTWLEHTYLGYNYRMDEMSAALGTVQMSRIDELIRSRQRVSDWYREELADIDAIELPHTAATTTRDSWFVYVIRLKEAERRNEVKERFGYEPGRFPVTEDLGRRGLAIPFSGKMTREQVAQVGSALRQIFY